MRVNVDSQTFSLANFPELVKRAGVKELRLQLAPCISTKISADKVQQILAEHRQEELIAHVDATFFSTCVFLDNFRYLQVPTNG